MVNLNQKFNSINVNNANSSGSIGCNINGNHSNFNISSNNANNGMQKRLVSEFNNDNRIITLSPSMMKRYASCSANTTTNTAIYNNNNTTSTNANQNKVNFKQQFIKSAKNTNNSKHFNQKHQNHIIKRTLSNSMLDLNSNKLNLDNLNHCANIDQMNENNFGTHGLLTNTNRVGSEFSINNSNILVNIFFSLIF